MGVLRRLVAWIRGAEEPAAALAKPEPETIAEAALSTPVLPGIAIGRWTQILVAGHVHPVHLEVHADGKNVATVYREGALNAAVLTEPDQYGRRQIDQKATLERLTDQRMYWRGESYEGMVQALQMVAMLVVLENTPGARA